MRIVEYFLKIIIATIIITVIITTWLIDLLPWRRRCTHI